MTDLAEFGLAGLSAGVAAGRFSPVEIVDACFARIRKYEPRLHAFIDLYEREARLEAEEAARAIRSGKAKGPLHGLPIAIKDLIEIESKVTTGGSIVWKDRVSTETATLVRKLTDAGMIVLGKTHTVEFAYGAWGTNQHMGTPWNPWDLEIARTPGGSSSGTGVAIAARMVPAGLGTDTGGSVRIPAAWCGITGLKTSVGRISTHGVLPLSPTLDTPGPMARSVEDCALLLSAMQGPDPLDPLTQALPPADPFTALRHGIKGLRLARLPEKERAGHDPEILKAYDRSVEELAGLGAEIVTLPDLGYSLREYGDLVGRIISAEVYPRIRELADNRGLPLDEAVRPRVLAGATISQAQYQEVLEERDRRKKAFLAGLEGIDAVLTPTAMTPPIPLDAVDQTTTPAISTRWVNFLDLCALALPNGLTSQGLPSSLQVVCRSGAEALALRIGWAYENSTDWHLMAPSFREMGVAPAS
jgi:aspartyl-tRNA(Asn)/glutamyl-tRNA(Gln) amidotransferase subunit A